ncbi:prolyl 4-hydroxylase subunit alpha-1 [Ixodes scapularis]|uniref:prolyl 4-hydroxylase subunit alpha-1 n=1 Tax=Ixodes scapularis TaxID=6945 RepID=UPI001A9FE5EF|nr:prolyl 4-hydroxylase subunit alpha-1 [Ixodes scapularis]
MEKFVKTDLLRYVERLKVLQDSILNFVQDKQPYDDLTSPSAVSEYLKHPVHAFHLIKRMTAGLGDIEALINKTRTFDPLVNVMEMRKQRLLPRDEDFTGLAGSLVRLQDTYALDLHELTKGHIRSEILRNRSVPGRLPLNAKDCFNISQVALRHGFYDRAVEWAEQAIAKATQEQPFTIPKQELDTFYKAAIEKHDEVLSTMGEAGNHWQTYGVPVRERANRSTEFKAQLFDEEIEDDQVNQNYKRLCRGEQLRTPKMDSQLRCRYYAGESGFFKLQPMKLEEYNLKPYVVVLRDLLQDRDLDDMIAFAEPRLQQSKTSSGSENDEPPDRTSSNAWLNDYDAPVAERVNKHLQSLLGLGTLYGMSEAEQYQLANYGIGGHYVPHHDYLEGSIPSCNDVSSPKRILGDRMATLMIYMSDVEEGGATVFPHLGVRVSPKKGVALFWWNIKSSWEGDPLTLHAGCPVLYGSKWIANKWFGSYSNVFRMPCSPNQNASLGPLV